MKRYILLLLFVFLFGNLAFGQNKKITVSFTIDTSNLLNVGVRLNGFSSQNFIFDTGASALVINSKLYRAMVQNRYLTNQDIIGSTKVIVADGSTIDAQIIRIASLSLGTIQIKNIEALVMPDSNAPLLIGQSVFNQFGKISIDYQKKVIEIEGENSNNQSNNQSVNSKLKELRIIPCNQESQKGVPSLKQFLNASLDIKLISEEKNIPPKKASDKIKGAITIRYFDNKDYKIALAIKNKILNASNADSNLVRLENMLPFYSYKAIPSYIEIWVK